MLETQITGLDELQKALDQLPVNVERKILRGALRAAQKVVMDRAKQLAPTAPPNKENQDLYGGYAGALRDSLRISTRKGRNGQVIARVIAGNKTAYYAHMVEFGTAKHLIKPKNRKSMLIAGMMREVVNHPGAQKKPFMRPAADAAMSESSEAMDAFKAYMAPRITKEISELPDESDGVTR